MKPKLNPHYKKSKPISFIYNHIHKPKTGLWKFTKKK